MQLLSENYNQIIQMTGHSFECRLDIECTLYGMDSIYSCESDSKLFSNEPVIGGVYSGTLDFTILGTGDSIPRMANVKPYYRAVSPDGTLTSEWVQKGSFYIDTRSTTKDGTGLATMQATAYDAMMKANAKYATSSLTWPAKDVDVVAEICSFMGVTQSPSNASIMTGNYDTELPVDCTYRDVLSYIGAMYGASWIMDDYGRLKLIKLTGVGDTLWIYNNIGSMEVSPARPPYTNVVMNIDEDTSVQSGPADNNTIEVTCPYATQSIVDSVYADISTFVYRPFEATGVWSNPAVEIGDLLVQNAETIGVIFSRVITFGRGMVMELSAPNDNYVDHEYVFESPAERQYKRTVAGMSSSIKLSANKIALLVDDNGIRGAAIITAINDDGSSVEISADKINLNGAVTANDNVQILTDGTIKAVNADISGTFNITGGKINIITSSASDDIIELKSGNYLSAMQPQAVTVSLGDFAASLNAQGLRMIGSSTTGFYGHNYIEWFKNGPTQVFGAYPDGIEFYDSTTGELTARYPATGLGVLHALQTPDTQAETGALIMTEIPDESTLYLLPTASVAEVVTAWLKWICANYKNKTYCIFEGILYVGSRRMVRAYIYDTNAVNSSGLPSYASGQLQNYDGNTTIFGTNSYAVYTKTVTAS